MSFDPSTNCIVVTYYSGSVNSASTNSQSLANVIIPPQVIDQGSNIRNKERRFWQHFDIVFRIPGLTDIISIYESISARRQKAPALLTETISISESKLRSVIRKITDSILLTGKVRTNSGLGTGSYIQLNSIQSFVSQISISAWVKFINADNFGYGGIVGLINGFLNNRLLLNEDAQTILFQLATLTSGTQSCSYTLPGSVFSNTWHHFAATWDGANMQLYYDGVVVGSPTPLTGVLLSGNTKTSIGMGAQNQFFLHGNMSEVALYNVGLTATQISNIYNNGANTVTTGQVAYYKLNEGSGSTVKNSAGSINGTLQNGPLWSSDIRSNITNRSIYSGFISDLISRVRTGTKQITESAISITDSLLRTIKARLGGNSIVTEQLSRLFKPLNIIQTTNITEGSGFTNGFTPGFTQPPQAFRTPIPRIAAQSTSISEAIVRTLKIIRTPSDSISIIESQLRKAIPKLTVETISISESKVLKQFKKISQTIAIVETQLRLMIPRFPGETISISDKSRRRPKPSIPTQSTSISEQSIFRAIIRPISQSTTISESISKIAKHFRTVAETAISIIETQLRKVIPKLPTQTPITISDSIFKKPIRNIATEIISVTESKLRKIIRFVTAETNSVSDSAVRTAKHFINVATQVISVAESQLRKPIPKIATQTTAISAGTISFIKGRFLSLLETITVSESISRLAKHFRTITETKSITETLVKKVFKFASDAISIAESKIRKTIPRLQDQLIVTITESLLRRVRPSLPQTTSISEILAVVRIFKRPVTETAISVLDALRRRIIRPQSGITSITESIPRKITRTLTLQSTTISEGVSKLRTVPRTLADNISITENTIKRFIKRLVSQTTAISETQIRRPVPKITVESTTTSDSIKKKATKFMTDIISVVETQLRKPIPKVATQSTTISDSQLRRIKPFISETIVIVESRLRKLIPNITAQSTTITESKLRRFIPSISQVVTITETQLRKIIRPVAGAVVISEAIRAGHLFSQKFITETVTVVEKLTRISAPRISTQSISLSASISRLRTVRRNIIQSITISESLKGAHQILRIIIESPISITESRLRTFIPRISTQLTPILGTLFYNSIREAGLLVVVALSEFVYKIEERLEAETAGPSFRWRFNPFRKSSFTNKFTPKRSGNR